MNKKNLLLLTLIASTTGLQKMYPAATRIAFVDPFATARGNAFTATADNPSAVFYNAAGLTQLEGTQVQGNVFAISLGYEFDGDLTGKSDMDDKFQEVPSFFFSHSFKDSPFSIGFGAYAPFALGTDWGSNAAFATADPSVPYRADLEYVKYHAVAAWQITETLSVAAGLSIDDTSIDIRTNALGFDGDDQAIGYSLSALWQPNQHHSFGFNYQAKTETTYQGSASGPVVAVVFPGSNSVDTSADLTYPESIVFGYSYRPNHQWNFEFNLDWTNWDRVNELELKGTPFAYELNWESAFIWELGVTHYLDNGWHISGGYTYVENAVPDDDLLPIVPDSDRHFFAIGIGHTWEQLSWQLTYQQAFASERSVKGNNHSPTINGDYDLDSQAIACSLSYAF
jgi:long-chain fatty acid transport protein